jgi:hypothetical protein
VLATSVGLLPERIDLTFIATVQSLWVASATIKAAADGVEGPALARRVARATSSGGILGVYLYAIAILVASV